jgi:Nucleotidyl transferase AbiEii toxin, Type IV TA system
MAKAEAADQADIPDGMSVPEELARRKVRLEKLAAARATIEARARERFEREQAEYQAKLAARAAKTEATLAFGWRTPSVPECWTGRAASRRSRRARNERSDYCERILAALTEAEFTLDGEPMKRDESQFFSVNLFYPSLFVTGPGLRPHLRVEMTLTPPTLPPVARPIGSLIGMTERKPPEVPAFPCVDPVETAADKLSALAWRVHARQRGSDKDNPTIIRHLHDLAALRETVAASSGFADLVRHAAAGDVGRGGEATASIAPATLLSSMLDKLGADKLWANMRITSTRSRSRGPLNG